MINLIKEMYIYQFYFNVSPFHALICSEMGLWIQNNKEQKYNFLVMELWSQFFKSIFMVMYIVVWADAITQSPKFFLIYAKLAAKRFSSFSSLCPTTNLQISLRW